MPRPNGSRPTGRSADHAPRAAARHERIPEGRYVLVVTKVERGPGWMDRRTGRMKDALYVHCEILEGAFRGTRLFLPVNMTFRTDRAWPSSAFYHAWCVAMDRKPALGERMSVRAFLGKVFEGEVATVRRDGMGRLRPSITEYSRVSRLIRFLGIRDAYLPPENSSQTSKPQDKSGGEGGMGCAVVGPEFSVEHSAADGRDSASNRRGIEPEDPAGGDSASVTTESPLDAPQRSAPAST